MLLFEQTSNIDIKVTAFLVTEIKPDMMVTKLNSFLSVFIYIYFSVKYEMTAFNGSIVNVITHNYLHTCTWIC
jgi:hypothetical protein